MHKNAQITVILIMIILLLGIFGAISYLKGSLTERRGAAEIQKQKITQEKMKPVRDYVTSCLDIATKTGLDFMGKQGGNLYVTQGGPIPDFQRDTFGKEWLEYETYKVAYALYPPRGKVANYLLSEPPGYPFWRFPTVKNTTDNSTIHDMDDPYLFGYYGQNKLPELQKPFKDSLEYQLEVFVINNTLNCLDWSGFQLQNMEIVAGEPSINVTIGKKDVYFFFTYPLNVTDMTTGADATMGEFSVKYPLRLIDIFEFIEFIADRDNTDLGFKILDAEVEGMRAQIITNVRNNDDVIIIKDTHSMMIDKPFEFRFAAHNRPPALFWINNTRDAPLIEAFTICSVKTSDEYIPAVIKTTNDSFIIENAALCPEAVSPRRLVIPLKALDPDDENITFGFRTRFEQNDISQRIVDEATVRFFDNNRLRGVEPTTMDIIIAVSDGEMRDYETISFPTHLEPVVS